VTGGLDDLFRHNVWANLRVIDLCSGVSDQQLDATVDGTYGTIRATLVHIVGAEEAYLKRLTADERWDPMDDDWWEGFDELRRRTTDAGEALVAEAGRQDVDRVVRWVGRDDGVHRSMRASLLLTQTINHSTDHRSQVFTILTQVGVEPPELDGWSYARATDQLGEGDW
jgi:uncharacterized damage-inducible protein DinB